MKNEIILLRENEDVKKLTEILNSQKIEVPLSEYQALLSQIEKLENQLVNITSQLSAVTEQLNEIQDSPVKSSIKNAVQNIENKVNEAKSHLNNIKDDFIAGTKQALESFKEKGISVLSSALSFIKVKDGLNFVKNTLQGAENQLIKAVNKLEQLEQKAQKPSVIGNLDTLKKQVAEKESLPKGNAKKLEAAL